MRIPMGGIVVRSLLVLSLAPGGIPEAAAQSQEGIKVHGHWVIEIRNPDGTLVERREFENALAAGGKALLAQYLARAGSPARWTIEFGGAGLVGPCNGGTFNAGSTNNCFIIDAAASPKPTGTAVFPTLTSSIGGANSDQVAMSGNATAIVQGQIGFVATRQDTCAGHVAPTDCNNAGNTLVFTSQVLRDSQGNFAPVSVAAGQIVQVTVIISFS